MQQTEPKGYQISAIIFCILFFLSYLIPEWATALLNQLNFFSNAWDEANYLTHQMALSLRYSPSYWFGENIYLLLESFGLSGSWQNILYDTLLPPAIVLITVIILRKILKISIATAIVYALLIWFSSILFSYANPLIGKLFSHQFPDDKSFLVAAVYPFPSILRTPNPQLSYFLIVAFISLYIKFKKWYLLLIPLPFLYFPVFIFYFYLVSAYIFYEYINIKEKALIANLLSTLLIFILLFFLSHLPTTKEWVFFSILTSNQAYLMAGSHKFQMPLIFIIFLLPLPWILVNRKRLSPYSIFFYNTFMWALLICVNTQIVTGLMFAPKIFQSDGAVIISGLLMVMVFYNFKNIFNFKPELNIENVLVFLILLISLGGMLKIQNFSFSKMSYSIDKYPLFTDVQLTILKHSPFVLITGDQADFYAQNLPYAIAGIYVPLQSIHYTYLPIMKSCTWNSIYLDKAISYVKSHNLGNKEKLLSGLETNAKQNLLVKKFLPMTFQNLRYCSRESLAEPNFNIINLSDCAQR